MERANTTTHGTLTRSCTTSLAALPVLANIGLGASRRERSRECQYKNMHRSTQAGAAMAKITRKMAPGLHPDSWRYHTRPRMDLPMAPGVPGPCCVSRTRWGTSKPRIPVMSVSFSGMRSTAISAWKHKTSKPGSSSAKELATATDGQCLGPAAARPPAQAASATTPMPMAWAFAAPWLLRLRICRKALSLWPSCSFQLVPLVAAPRLRASAASCRSRWIFRNFRKLSPECLASHLVTEMRSVGLRARCFMRDLSLVSSSESNSTLALSLPEARILPLGFA
mmetsp:Transcript_9287/g.26080  ORF Transcript_9287/g.26080 Transcript_9287/m.26080 type:complete len:281 (-) Transcript_9287:110-952(-)